MAAIRQEDLAPIPGGGLVVAFPTATVRARAARDTRLLYIRRRIAVAALSLVLALGGAGLVKGAVAPAAVASASGAPRSVVVTPGQTLWELARRHAAPGTDPRAYVGAVLELNGLEAPPPVGARIKLPRSS